MVLTNWTINAIKDAVRATGSHWFDPSSMRFFGTRVGETVYQGPGGIYFVTSEMPPHGPRRYSVRQFTPPGDIETIGEVASMGRSAAVRLAKELAKTPLEQQLLGAMVDLDVAVIGDSTTKDRANQYRNGPSLQQIAEGGSHGIVYMQDGGYTRWIARQYDGGGFYLQLVDGGEKRKKPWSDAYDLQREVCRILQTFATGAFCDDTTETAEEFEPISELEQFVSECRKHGYSATRPDDVAELIALAKLWRKDREDMCNIANHKESRGLRKKIGAVAVKVGAVKVILDGDPRGCTVKLVWSNGETNDFGKEGWCVPGA